MIHRGEIVEAAVRQSGIAISEVARRMKKSRRHLYNIFEDPNVPLDTIIKIGRIIHHDFTKEIADVQIFYPHNQSVPSFEESQDESYKNANQSVTYWKDKYFELLEKYNNLLENKLFNPEKTK